MVVSGTHTPGRYMMVHAPAPHQHVQHFGAKSAKRAAVTTHLDFNPSESDVHLTRVPMGAGIHTYVCIYKVIN